MPQLLWELKIILCDLCKKNEMKKVIQIGREFKGVCIECKPKDLTDRKKDDILN